MRTELSLLSDLNFSTMSEDCINWSSLVPTSKTSLNNDQYTSLSEIGDKIESLQDAFKRSRKKFIADSRQRQDNVKRNVAEKIVKKKWTQQTNVALKRDQQKVMKNAGTDTESSKSSGAEKLDKGINYIHLTDFLREIL